MLNRFLYLHVRGKTVVTKALKMAARTAKSHLAQLAVDAETSADALKAVKSRLAIMRLTARGDMSPARRDISRL